MLLKLALRRLIKDKQYTLINIIGLAVALCAFLTLDIHTHFQESFDKFFKDAERIYRINTHWIQEGRSQGERSGAVPPFAWRLPQSLPEIEEITRLHNTEPKRQIVSYSPVGGQRVMEEETSVYYADSNFFKVFDIPFRSGDPHSALSQPYTAIVSREGAQRYFGDANPIGKALMVNGERAITYTITGVYDDIPGNSHLPDVNLLLSLSTKLAEHPEWDINNHWYWQRFFTYIKLRKGANAELFKTKFQAVMSGINEDIYVPRAHKMKASLMSLTDIHSESKLEDEFKPAGNGQITQLLYWVGWIIVLVALFNYVNMTTAKSVERAREIGIRKVLGSQKTQLTFQLLTESFVLGLLVLSVGLALTYLILPYFDQITDQQLTKADLPIEQLTISLVGFLILMILANLYPALIMSALKPSVILKSNYGSSAKGTNLRLLLVTAQFAVSIIIMLVTSAAYQQMNQLLDRDMGFEDDQLLIIKAPRTKTDRYYSQYDYFRNEISASSSIKAFSTSTFVPGFEQVGFRSMRSRHMDQAAIMRFHRVDYNIINTLGLELLAGRDFDPAHQTDQSAVIITASALSVFGFDSPSSAIGERLSWSNNVDEDLSSQVIAVIGDYQQNIKSNEKIPKVFAFLRGYESPWNDEYFLVKFDQQTTANQHASILTSIESLWSEQFPDDPFDYYFMDTHLERVVANEAMTTKLMAVFGMIAIVIANLGLLSMILFIVNQRMREISIRKVLGASVFNIARLINRECLITIVVASLIALPTGAWLIDHWMQQYEVRPVIPIWSYGLPVLILLSTALIVSANHTIKTALQNPIRFLRNE